MLDGSGVAHTHLFFKQTVALESEALHGISMQSFFPPPYFFNTVKAAVRLVRVRGS